MEQESWHRDGLGNALQVYGLCATIHNANRIYGHTRKSSAQEQHCTELGGQQDDGWIFSMKMWYFC